MTDTKPRRWASRKVAAAHLGVHPTSIDRLASAGKIRKYQIEGTPMARYDLDELDALMKPAA